MKRIIAWTAFLILAGCSGLPVRYTDISGVADPHYTGRQYRTVLVRVESHDLILRKHLEQVIAGVFADQGVAAYSDVLLFPPTRDWNTESVRAVYDSRNIHALLVLHDFEFGADSVYVPGSATTREETETYTDTTGRTPVDKKNTTVTTTYTDPRISAKPWFAYNATLYDTDTDEKAWVASGHTRGSLPGTVIAKDIGRALFRGLMEYALLYHPD